MIKNNDLFIESPAKVSRIKTVAFNGINPVGVDVEVSIERGIPAFNIVGLPSKSVNESRNRISAVFNLLGVQKPPGKITINLAPADIEKRGSHYDVPIALALLVEIGVLDPIDDHVAIGELSLDGKFLPVPGTLLAAVYAEASSLDLICPELCGQHAVWGVEKSKVIAAPSLHSLINHIKGRHAIPEPKRHLTKPYSKTDPVSLDEIQGQEDLKRAIKLACAGRHHILMIGPPGIGKSTMGKAMQHLMPNLTRKQSLETTIIHSVFDKNCDQMIQTPPFRSPHYTVSTPGLIGGGSFHPMPGEISLAHNGILFLDEFPEFDLNAINSLRLAIEERETTITRVNYRVVYPADFILVAAMNPCGCGYYGKPGYQCHPKCRERYVNKISGPILDRIDIVLNLSHAKHQSKHPETHAQVQQQIQQVRLAQKTRFENENFEVNSQIPSKQIDKFVRLSPKATSVLQNAMQTLDLSMRGRDRSIRLARTIADFRAHDSDINSDDIMEALSYRQSAFIS